MPDAPSELEGAPSRTLARSSSVAVENRDHFECKMPPHLQLTIVVLGASGDLAKKKTFPALFELYKKRFLPLRLQIVGYARSALTADALRERLRGYIKDADPRDLDAFLSKVSYLQGEYDPGAHAWEELRKVIEAWEGTPGAPAGRLFYLALPPNTYPEVCAGLKSRCADLGPDPHPKSWVRVIVEKPFGSDLHSSEVLADQLGALFPEDQLYRIDHYLGKELTQNMLVMRFANPIFSAWWNRHYISNVQVSFKEDFGTQGRGGYFDQYGIIRDVIQNHLIQVLAIIAMEQPVSAHPDDIRDEKTRLLRCIRPLAPKDCVLGQYTAANGEPGYLDDPTVPPGSKTPTFAACKLMIDNERWAGVPFILKAGKALNEKVVNVRMQLRSQAVALYGLHDDSMRNEFVMRLQPGEAIYIKMVVKKPGLEMETEMSELDLSYADRYKSVLIPDAYERLILDCIRGDQQHFVRRDELRASWSIFTPLLHRIDAGELHPHPYPYGSRGPPDLDTMLSEADYVRTTKYIWRPPGLMAPGSPSGPAPPQPLGTVVEAADGKPLVSHGLLEPSSSTGVPPDV